MTRARAGFLDLVEAGHLTGLDTSLADADGNAPLRAQGARGCTRRPRWLAEDRTMTSAALAQALLNRAPFVTAQRSDGLLRSARSVSRGVNSIRWSARSSYLIGNRARPRPSNASTARSPPCSGSTTWHSRAGRTRHPDLAPQQAAGP